MKITRRAMEKQDLNQVSAIENLSFLTPWSLKSLEEELKNKMAVYVVLEDEEEDRILGYGGFWKVLDEGHITNIAIHPEFRGMGLGHELMNYLVKTAKEQRIRILFLEVREHNESAKKLYKQHGFLMVGLRRGYYSDSKEDAILMEKTIALEDGGMTLC